MKYILIFSFIYKHHRKKFNVRLFSDHYLLDDIELTKDISYRTIDRTKTSIKYRNIPQFDWWYPDPISAANLFHDRDVPENIRVYEIDESVLGDQLRIEVEDYSSNSTNGFINKSSMIMIDSIFLFPKFLFESRRALRKLGDMVGRNPRFIEHTKPDVPPADLNRENIIEWPGNGAVVEDGHVNIRTWHGGVKTLSVPLYKKYNTHFLNPCGVKDENRPPIKWCFNPKFFEFDETFKILPIKSTGVDNKVGRVKLVSLRKNLLRC